MKSADFYCRKLATSHYENFSVASPFVGLERRRDLWRIYAYCRTTDDFGDEHDLTGAGESAARTARLQRWREDVAGLFAGALPIHPVLIALRDTIERHGLRAQSFLDLIDANVQDQHVDSYEDWATLRDYCSRSAAPVGRMVLGVFEVKNPRAGVLSDDVCIGLQLANFAQDVSLDTARGRSYLLQHDLRAGGTIAATRAHCERARGLLASGIELEHMVPSTLRRQLVLYRFGGLAILDQITRSGYRTAQRRPRVSLFAKCALLLRALCTPANRATDAAGLEPV
ncbi:MAG: squalene/phytoene synthase family protein [Candidatus Baltobacteraceae bacterium]